MATALYVTEKALNVPELLEAILLELPRFDLIKLRRTSKTFKAMIEHSSKIHRKLFYQARVGIENGLTRINPFLPYALRHHGFGGTIEIFGIDDEGFTTSHNKRQIDRTLCRRPCGALAHGEFDLDLHCFDPALFKPANENSFYKDMLITDSPIKVFAHFWCSGKRVVRVETLGQLIEACCLMHTKYSNWRYEES